MYEKFIEVIGTVVSEHLMLDVVLVGLCAAAIIVSMAVDLIFGIHKAKQNGRATTSTGLKKTCQKAQKYFSPFLVLVCVDFITMVVIPFPAFSMLWAAYCVFCEFISVREKAWQKEDIRKQERTMSIIIENKDDIVDMVAKLLKQNSDGQKTD